MVHLKPCIALREAILHSCERKRGSMKNEEKASIRDFAATSSQASLRNAATGRGAAIQAVNSVRYY